MPNLNKYALIQTDLIGEYQIKANIYEHNITKAQIIDLQCDDLENAFCIAFKTPSYGDTGVAHILEHSVFCSSRNYPVKEAFGELVKSSLNTFLNALTYPDKTIYLFATMNNKDYINLMKVYLDCTLFPVIDEKIFKQEGWHLEKGEKNDLIYKGVVFNEMKGSYSNPDRYLGEDSTANLFPDTIYSRSSGGNPLVIPSLTFEEFCEFHKKFYHPSNSTIFLYGNQTEDESRWEVLDNYLDQFEYREIIVLGDKLEERNKTVTNSLITLQKAFDKPKEATNYYPASELSAITWSYSRETELMSGELMEVEIINRLLVAKSTSPLRKALIDSGLGEEYIASEDLDPLPQLLIMHGMKGVKTENLDKLNEIYKQALNQIIIDGFSPDSIEAVLNRFEFELREVDFGYSMYPRGLKLVDKILIFSLYNRGFADVLAFEKNLKELRAKIQQDPNYLVNQVRELFIENNFKVTTKFLADKDFLANKEKLEKETLLNLQKNISGNELDKIVETQKALNEWQQAPDSPEALATIPVINLLDVDKYTSKNLGQVVNQNLIFTKLNSAGIVYLDFSFDLCGVEVSDFSLLPSFISLFGKLGTNKYTDLELQNLLGIYTGGLGLSLIIDNDYNGNLINKLAISTKCLEGNLQIVLELVNEIILNTQFNNLENLSKIKQIITENKSIITNSLASNGHVTILTRLMAGLSADLYLKDQINGYTQTKAIENYLENLEKQPEIITNKLINFQKNIFNQSNLMLAFGNNELENHIIPIESFIQNLPNLQTSKAHRKIILNPKSEDLILDTQVNYVANIYQINQKNWFKGSFLGVINYLRIDYLWNKVRIQGGAYGCMVMFKPLSGIFGFVSYRDPNLDNTYQIYDTVIAELEMVNLSKEHLNKLIIGAFGDLDYKLTNSEINTRELIRVIKGETELVRQKIRNELFQTNLNDFKKLAEILRNSQTQIKGAVKAEAKHL